MKATVVDVRGNVTPISDSAVDSDDEPLVRRAQRVRMYPVSTFFYYTETYTNFIVPLVPRSPTPRALRYVFAVTFV